MRSGKLSLDQPLAQSGEFPGSHSSSDSLEARALRDGTPVLYLVRVYQEQTSGYSKRLECTLESDAVKILLERNHIPYVRVRINGHSREKPEQLPYLVVDGKTYTGIKEVKNNLSLLKDRYTR